MDTFYYADNGGHDPAWLHDQDPWHTILFSEVAERGRRLHDAVKQAAFGAILEPEDFGMAPLEAVHTADMLELLQTAYHQVAAEMGAPRPVMPDTFPVGQPGARRPRTIFGRLGLYCYDTSTPIFELTWQVAYWSAQVALSAAARVHQGAPVAYGLCRPPGHHASAGAYGGFCYLNNVAIAAEWLVASGHRVAIADVDYHHGNGTQSLFYDRPDVFFCSIHADPADDYPFYWGYAAEQGHGPGEGYNLNLPLPLGTGPFGYMPALEQALSAIRHFAPDTLLISLGVDTEAGDPVGSFQLDQAAFGHIGAAFASLERPAVVIQEGGYLLPAIGANVVAFFQGLLGQVGKREA
jgi:acetoin utilization deacetylase AcuC-like enzyme